MKIVLVCLLVVLFFSCSHEKWLLKNKDRICESCPNAESNIVELTDTTFYSIIPADTCYLEGLDFPNDSVIIDNNGYKIVKVKGKTIVITKEKKIPHYITRYKNNNNSVKTVEIIKYKVPYWTYAIAVLIFILGYFFRKIFWK